MASTKIILNSLYGRVETAMSNKANVDKLKMQIAKVIDANIDKLQDIGPIRSVYCGGYDLEVLFETTGIKQEEVQMVIKKVADTGLKAQYSVVGNPFHVVLALTIRYFKIANKQDMVNLLLIYYGISLYPLLFKKYFKYNPNPQIMEYTINNLSNKYKIKQLGNMFKVVEYSLTTADETTGKYLLNGTDQEILNYIQDKRTRLNDIFKNIRDEFDKAHKANKYLNDDFDNMDEENYHESDSNTFAVDRITDKVLLKLVTNGPDVRIITTSAKINKVSVNELRNYIFKVVNSDHRSDVRKIIERILTLFLLDGRNTVDEIRSDKFMYESLELYKKSNTGDQNIKDIKAILDKWLEEVDIYSKTNRKATVNDFRKAMFTFFVFTIQLSN